VTDETRRVPGGGEPRWGFTREKLLESYHKDSVPAIREKVQAIFLYLKIGRKKKKKRGHRLRSGGKVGEKGTTRRGTKL